MQIDLAYIAEIMPDAQIECACGCEKKLLLDTAVLMDNRFWHSQAVAERETAVVRKPQPKGMVVDGWDV